ncbi:MAG: hypothetical protein WCV59_00655 [Parcubacteria group bacterium]|jgi:hypothetical protein
MPRKDLSKKLVASLLSNSEGIMGRFFERVERIGGSYKSGHIKYKIFPKESVIFSSDALYRGFADFFRDLNYIVDYEEFQGDIEGMFIACGGNTIFFHIELDSNQLELELNAWLRD